MTPSKLAEQSSATGERTTETVFAQCVPQQRGVDSKNWNARNGLDSFDHLVHAHVGAALNDGVELVALVVEQAHDGATGALVHSQTVCLARVISTILFGAG